MKVNLINLQETRNQMVAVGPDHVDMTIFVHGILDANQEPRCGTVGCIAGWAAAVQNKALGGIDDSVDFNVPGIAREFLGLSDEGESGLFYVSDWPSKFYTMYHSDPIYAGETDEDWEAYMKLRSKVRFDATIALLDDILAGNDPWQAEANA